MRKLLLLAGICLSTLAVQAQSISVDKISAVGTDDNAVTTIIAGNTYEAHYSSSTDLTYESGNNFFLNVYLADVNNSIFLNGVRSTQAAGTITFTVPNSDVLFEVNSANYKFIIQPTSPTTTTYTNTPLEDVTLINQLTWANSAWTPAYAPSSSLDLVFDQDYSVAESTSLLAHNIKVNAGNTLTVPSNASLNANGTITNNGNITNNGTFIAPNYSLTLTGTTAQTYGGGTLKNLTIDNAAGVSLTGNLSVNGALTLTNGILNTGANTIDLGSSGSLVGENNTNYINGNIRSKKTVDTDPEDFGGIGLSITPTTALGSTTVIRTTGINGIQTNPDNALNKGIERTYEIIPTTNINLNASVTFTYLDHELNSIMPDNLRTFRKNESGPSIGKWEQMGGLTIHNVEHFSLWTLGDNNAPLPVDLISYTATKKANEAVLEWATATETNNAGFEIEVSQDGKNFSSLAKVDATPASTNRGNNYQYTDNSSARKGLQYYRLLQHDTDGTVNYLGVRSLRFYGKQQPIAVYPVPFSNEFTAQVTAANTEVARVQLYDALGRLVLDKKVQLNAGENQVSMTVDNNLTTGTYMLKVITSTDAQHLMVVKQ